MASFPLGGTARASAPVWVQRPHGARLSILARDAGSTPAERRGVEALTAEVARVGAALERLQAGARVDATQRGAGQIVASVTSRVFALEAGDAQAAIASVAALASLESGGFRVNGQSFAIDTAVDSLDDVLARVRAAGAGVTAHLVSGGQRIAFSADAAGGTLRLEGPLFDALEIAPGTYASAAALGRAPAIGAPRFADVERIRSDLVDVSEALVAVFQRVAFAGAPAGLVADVHARLRETILEALAPGADAAPPIALATDFGLTLAFPAQDALGVALDGVVLERALASRFDELSALLFEPALAGRPDGLVPALLHTTATLLSELVARLEPSVRSGLHLDLVA